MDIASSTLALFAAWPADWVILSGIAALFALECFKYGSNRTSAIAIAMPVCFLIAQWLPTTFITDTVARELVQPIYLASMFAVVFVGVYLLAYRMVFSFNSTGSVLQALLCGGAAAVIIVVVWIQTPGLKDLWQFSPQITYLFVESYRAWWLVGGYVALAFALG